jgi:hypothetical protein
MGEKIAINNKPAPAMKAAVRNEMFAKRDVVFILFLLTKMQERCLCPEVVFHRPAIG